MPTSARFTARLRLTAWVSPCQHDYEAGPRREREAQQWVADDIYRDLTAALPGRPGTHGEFFEDVANSAKRTGRSR